MIGIRLSHLKCTEHTMAQPTFDEIILNIMPLLKNGVTSERQTILKVLERVAEPVDVNRWRLATVGHNEFLEWDTMTYHKVASAIVPQSDTAPSRSALRFTPPTTTPAPAIPSPAETAR